MEKKVIRITEGQLRSMIYDSISEVINGAGEDDGENKKIRSRIKKALGGTKAPRKLYFPNVVKMMYNDHGMTYSGSDEGEGCHNFSDGTRTVSVYPISFLPQQGFFRLKNVEVR